MDEYWDTNHARYQLVRERSAPTRRHRLTRPLPGRRAPAELTVVGDSDRSIYAFHDADILSYPRTSRKDYPNAHTILSRQNYRSTQNILSRDEHAVIEQLRPSPQAVDTPPVRAQDCGLRRRVRAHAGARYITTQASRLADEHGVQPVTSPSSTAPTRSPRPQGRAPSCPDCPILGGRWYPASTGDQGIRTPWYLHALSNP